MVLKLFCLLLGLLADYMGALFRRNLKQGIYSQDTAPAKPGSQRFAFCYAYVLLPLLQAKTMTDLPMSSALWLHMFFSWKSTQ
ncbi:MAG TPA: hypothetical protein VGN63_25015 [Flavisolibacter sp.]|jgi:hypothetical protein|nr:hypothetical protein [Flavisolibacter sp.]